MRYDIIADTHGYLSAELLAQLQGADVIVHAGDICSGSDFRKLEKIAPLMICLGNNDYPYEYGPDVKNKCAFFSSGLRWQVCHYRERLDLVVCDIAIFGHTHRPFLERTGAGVLLMNPGSTTYPRGGGGPTMGRIYAEEGRVLSAETFPLAR